MDVSNIYKILDSSNTYSTQEDTVDITDKYQCIFQGNNITIKITCSSQYLQKTSNLNIFHKKTKLVKQMMKEEYSENKFSKEQYWRTHTFQTEILAQKKG